VRGVALAVHVVLQHLEGEGGGGGTGPPPRPRLYSRLVDVPSREISKTKPERAERESRDPLRRRLVAPGAFSVRHLGTRRVPYPTSQQRGEPGLRTSVPGISATPRR
jgi:hypothetical protein